MQDAHAEERRHSSRHTLFQPAQLVLGRDETRRVHLLNLSSGGALLYGEAPEPGTQVNLRCGGLALAARVVWQIGRRFGVAFAVSVPQAQVEATLRARDAMIARASLRLGLAEAWTPTLPG